MPEQPPFTIRITRRAQKDIEKLTPKLRRKLREVMTNRIAEDPTSGKKAHRRPLGLLVGPPDLSGSNRVPHRRGEPDSLHTPLPNALPRAVTRQNHGLHGLHRLEEEPLGPNAASQRIREISEIRG